MSKSRFFNVENMHFITIHENKILAKISAFTILKINRYFFQTVKTQIKRTVSGILYGFVLKQATLFARRNNCMPCSLQIKKNVLLNRRLSCSCSETIFSKSIKKIEKVLFV